MERNIKTPLIQIPKLHRWINADRIDQIMVNCTKDRDGKPLEYRVDVDEIDRTTNQFFCFLMIPCSDLKDAERVRDLTAERVNATRQLVQ